MLAGSLSEFGLADVFTLLASTRKTGILELTADSSAGRVWITQGGLALAVADTTRCPLAARLLHAGELDTEQVEAVVTAQAAADATALQSALEGLGIDADRVRQLLLDQITDAVFDLSRWTDGTFAFHPAPPPSDPDGTGPVTTAQAVMATVAERLEAWPGTSSRRPPLDAVLELVSRPRAGDAGIVVQPSHWEVLTLVDGLRTVADVVALTGLGQFVASGLVADLVADGLVQVVPDPTGRPASQHRRLVLDELELRLLGAAPTEVATPSSRDTAGARTEAASSDDRREQQPTEQEQTEQNPAEPEPTQAADEDAAEQDLVAPGEGHDPDVRREADRRARELAALGLGPQPEAAESTEQSDSGRGRPVDPALLARLIDGVKGA